MTRPLLTSLAKKNSGKFGPVVFAALTVVLTPVLARADHPALSFGTEAAAGPIKTISPTTLPQGEAILGLQMDYLKFRTFSDDALRNFAARDVEAHSTRSLLVASLGLSYGLAEDFTLSVRLPYVRRSDIREGESADEVHRHGNSRGIGDLAAIGKYRVLNDTQKGRQASIMFGLKAPTGPTRASDLDGNRFETDHQPGSGSWDPILGAAASSRIGFAAIHGSVLYKFASTGARSTNLGDRLQYGLGLTHRISGDDVLHSHAHESSAPTAAHRHSAWDLTVELDGEWEGSQKIAGLADPNSGGHRLFVSPGVRFVSTGAWAGYLSLGFPVIQRLNGIQDKAKARLISGVAWKF